MEEHTQKTDHYDYITDKLIGQKPEAFLPENFTDKLMVRIEKRASAQIVFGEFLIKTAISIVLIGVGTGVVFIPAFKDFLTMLLGLSKYGPVVFYGLIIGLFTLVFDQLILRFFLRIRKNHR